MVLSKANHWQSEPPKGSPQIGDGVAGSSSDAGPLCVTDLVRNYHQAVYGYAFRLSGNAADAEDLSQQTFLIAHEKLTQLREPSKARAWLLRIVRTSFLKRIRRRRPVNVGSLELSIDDAPDRSRAVSEIDEQRLHLGLNALSDDFRIILMMFYFEDLSYREIASSLELPLGTVMSRLSRAKQMLKQELQGTDVCQQAERMQPRQAPASDASPTAKGPVSAVLATHLSGGERKRHDRS